MPRGAGIETELRNAIVRGDLAPASRLRLEDLKTRFEVGFSPIREALSRLLGNGLVELEPNCGFRVSRLSRRDLSDIALMRVSIESVALRRSIEFGDDRWEAALIGAMHRYRRRSEGAFTSDDNLRDWEAAHDELHTALISACGSPRLLTQQRLLLDQHLRYRRLIVIPEVSEDAHVEEHERLVALALSRDAATAVAELERHMMITVDALASAQYWMSTAPD